MLTSTSSMKNTPGFALAKDTGEGRGKACWSCAVMRISDAQAWHSRARCSTNSSAAEHMVPFTAAKDGETAGTSWVAIYVAVHIFLPDLQHSDLAQEGGRVLAPALCAAERRKLMEMFQERIQNSLCPLLMQM